MFLLLRALFPVLIIGCFFGCGTDEDISREIPVVTIELIQQESKEAWFRLNLTPAPTTDLAVLIESKAWDLYDENQEISYAWFLIPKFTNSHDFKFFIDDSVYWNVKIRTLVGIDLNAYPIEGSEVPAGFTFSQYKVGEASSVTVEPAPPARLLDEWPRSSNFRSIPANATLTFIFDIAPEDITVSHGKVVTDDNVVTVGGPFPIGDIEVELIWNKGRKQEIWYGVFTEPDVDPPKIKEIWAFSQDLHILLWSGLSIENGKVKLLRDFRSDFEFTGLPPNTERIQIDFNERVGIHEKVIGNIDIQTEVGDNLGWEEKVEEFQWRGKLNELTVVRSDGKPLKPETTYVVTGKVTDFANETEIKLTFTTSEK